MTPEEKSLLESIYALAKENNEILISLRRRAQLGLAWKIAYWAVIVGISVGALYFIQPYVDMIKGLTGGAPSLDASSDNYAQQIQDLLK